MEILSEEAPYTALAIIGLILGMLGIHCHRWNSLIRLVIIFGGLFLFAFGLGSTLIIHSENVSTALGIDASATCYRRAENVGVLPTEAKAV